MLERVSIRTRSLRLGTEKKKIKEKTTKNFPLEIRPFSPSSQRKNNFFPNPTTERIAGEQLGRPGGVGEQVVAVVAGGRSAGGEAAIARDGLAHGRREARRRGGGRGREADPGQESRVAQQLTSEAAPECPPFFVDPEKTCVQREDDVRRTGRESDSSARASRGAGVAECTESRFVRDAKRLCGTE